MPGLGRSGGAEREGVLGVPYSRDGAPASTPAVICKGRHATHPTRAGLACGGGEEEDRREKGTGKRTKRESQRSRSYRS